MKDKAKHRFYINQKIIVFILITTFIVGFTGLVFIYKSEYNLLRQTIGRDYMTMGKLLSSAMDRIVNREIKSTEVFMSSSERLLKVEECNLRYVGMSKEQREAYFKDMDERWEKVSDNDPLITEYTESAVGKRLREIAQDDPDISEIFITDKYGGLVAASGRVSDFCQADEEWWQKSFVNGKGDVFLDRIGFDPSSKTVGIAVAVPIKNKSKEVIGVCKNILEINRLFSPLVNFSIGKTGHVALMDKDGNLIFHPGILAMTQKLPDQILKRIINQDSGYFLVNEVDQIHKKPQFFSYYKINHPVLLKSGVEWWICIDQDADEVFASLRELIFSFILVTLIMLVVVVAIGFLLGAILVKPIIKLRDATEKVAQGNLEYKVEIKTNDEIEDLADSFNSMLDSLKSTFTTIDKLNYEIVLRKKTEEALQKSEEQYHTLFTESRDAVMILLPDGKFLSGNPAAIKMFGCQNEEDFKTRSLAELSPEFQSDGSKSLDKSQEMMLLAIEKGSNLFEWTHKRLDGVEFIATVLLSKFVISGKTLLQATVRDITEQKKILNDLKSSALEWQRTFDSISDFIFIQNVNSVILKANKSFSDALKLKPEEIIGRKCFEIVHNLDHAWPSCPFVETCNDQKTHMEEVDDPRLGATLLITTSPIFKETGEFIGCVHIARDISQIKRYQRDLEKKNKELEKLDQLKSDFVSVVSHELRTPLSITKEGISLVLDGVTGIINPKQDKILTTSLNSIDRLARIINSLLDISKIESGRVELKKKSVDFKILIENVITLFAGKAKEKGIELKVNLPKEQGLNLYVDEDRMIQVFTNLIGNAIKFTEKGSISVTLNEKEKELECIISDTGVGIAAENLPKVFSKFMQFGRSTGAGEKGTGLGLSIVKGLVDLHRGRIWVESQVGFGSKFIFTLPKYPADQNAREYIEDAINDAVKNSAQISLLIATLTYSDKIKAGIPAEVLSELERIMKAQLNRGKDLVLKYPNEFISILHDCNKRSALVIQGRIEQAFRTYLDSINLGQDLKINLGCAAYPEEANNYQELISKARLV